VAAPIRIGTLDAVEAADLVDALAVRGLIGRSVEAGGHRWVELHETHEETERLVAEVSAAVADWLADRRRDEAEIRVGGRSIAVRSATDLDETLRDRLPSRADRPRT
jgi:hypothetical protein